MRKSAIYLEHWSWPKRLRLFFFDFEKPHGLSRAEKPLKAGNEGGCSGDPRRINSLRITVMNSS